MGAVFSAAEGGSDDGKSLAGDVSPLPSYPSGTKMDIYLFAVFILIALGVFDLIVGVSNDAVNFLTSSIGSRVAPHHTIMIIASLGMLAGVTFSSGMMEVARKGIFHPQYFVMPELIAIFLAVMLTDVILLDFFNTFGLPTSTTVSIVFELLGAAVAVSLLKIYAAEGSMTTLIHYINTGKALSIILGILLSVVVAFVFGALVQYLARLLFTFDYLKRMKRFGGVYGGFALSIITYFILIKGAKGTSFLTPETVAWIKTNAWQLLSGSFIVFAFLFQLIVLFTRINVFKPIVLIGTFALAMAFSANDLVNFIGVPLAGLSAYNVGSSMADPSTATMGALQERVQSNTLLLLIAGGIMLATLWTSKKARTVTKTTISLGRQDEGVERFGASTLSRIIVRMAYAQFGVVTKAIPVLLKRIISRRLDPTTSQINTAYDGSVPSFDLLRASVNLIVASAVVSLATSMKLPLSTTYVTFMVAMGTSLSDQAWGRESAVYRVTGVLAVIGGWFFTALIAFTVSLTFALIISLFELPAVLLLVLLAAVIIMKSYSLHFRREEDAKTIDGFSLADISDGDDAIRKSFEQTGHFLREISDTLDRCIDASLSANRQRLAHTKVEAAKIQQWTNVISANIFKTLRILGTEDEDGTQQYSHTIRSLQDIAESHRDTIVGAYEHFENSHANLLDSQIAELRQIKTLTARLLWNTSIMLLRRKKVDYDYIANQSRRLSELAAQFDKNQIKRIQSGESGTSLSILFYGLLGNCVKIANHTQELLNIFKVSFDRSTSR